jgi:Predicted membrane protein (DUF2079)
MPIARVRPALLAGGFFLAYAVVSVGRHRRLATTGFDLGIFEQAVRGYAEGTGPVADLKGPGFNLLGDHFHPVLVLLAPAYRLAPSAVTLLVAQAGLLAVSVIPITRLAMRHTTPRLGVLTGTAYGLSWGLQNAVGFDFHEVCFAVALLAFALEHLVERRWVAVCAWSLPLLLVKEDLPATVAAIGLYVAIVGRRPRLGLGVAAFAVAAGLLIVEVLIPSFNPSQSYVYAGATAPGSGWTVKAGTLVLLGATTCFAGLRSPVVLLAVPTLLWRFVGANPAYWGTADHYSAVLMPIVFAAFIDALGRRDPAVRAPWVAGAVALALGLTVTLPLADLVRPDTWHPPARVGGVRAVLAEIPDGASVAASNRLAAQLTGRCDVYLFPTQPSTVVRPDWVVLTDPVDLTLEAANVPARVDDLPRLGYEVVDRRPGVVLLHRVPDPR